MLTGSLFDAEVAKLTKQYGKDQVGQFLKTFDFVVNDSLKIVTAKKIALPSKPEPDPTNGPALARRCGTRDRAAKALTSR